MWACWARASACRSGWRPCGRRVSRRRVWTQLHAPIGLDIGGKAPWEVALSVIGEIVALRYAETSDAASCGSQAGERHLALSASGRGKSGPR